MSIKTDGSCKRVIVLDTSAFLAGYDPFSMGEEQVTVPKVEEEIKRSSVVKVRFETAVESGKVKIKVPTDQSLSELKASATALGDFYKLSATDLQLLALALELKGAGYTPQIVTDDYCIQNVATQIGVGFVSLATFGIKRLLEWIRYCPACHKQYPANAKFKECQICGTELKRKPKRTAKNLKN
jgi:endoribonuclease Nob1